MPPIHSENLKLHRFWKEESQIEMVRRGLESGMRDIDVSDTYVPIHIRNPYIALAVLARTLQPQPYRR